MVLIGNRLSPDFVSGFRTQAGWIFCAAIFLGFLWAAYDWLLDAPRESPRGLSRQTSAA